MNHAEEIRELIEYYRTQGAPSDQQMLIAMLREVQRMDGGVLSKVAILQIAEVCGVKESFLMAFIRRLPALRYEDIPHNLEVCGTCRLGGSLRAWIEEEYQVKSGSASNTGRFFYRVTGCMKNCKYGPSVRWDGTLIQHADIQKVRELIENG